MCGLIPLSSERPDPPVATADVLGVQVIQIPSQRPEPVLSRLHQKVHFSATFLHHPLLVSLHIPFGVSRANDGDFGLEQFRDRALPFVRGCRVAQAGVVQHEAVEVGVVGVEQIGLVEGVEIVHVCRYLHFVRDSVLHDRAEGVGSGPLW